MKKYKVLPGDMICKAGSVCVIYKETPKYFYYHMSGHDCRIKKEKLWFLVDTSDQIMVLYNHNKKRKLQKTMRTLDLHGLRYPEARTKLEEFLVFADPPCRIITGNSKKMKEILFSVAKASGLECEIESHYNLGAYVLFEGEDL